jgi:hypothetical protein
MLGIVLDILVVTIRNTCASATGAHPAYPAVAENLGRALAARNIGLTSMADPTSAS